MELVNKLEYAEREKRRLSLQLVRQIDNGRLEASEAELEVARLTNEKITLEELIRELQEKELGLVKSHEEVEGKYMCAIHKLERQVSYNLSCLVLSGG
jgi:hypothetical protein